MLAFDELLGYPVGSTIASHISSILLANEYEIQNIQPTITSLPYRLATIPFTSKSNIWPFDIGACLTGVYFNESSITVGLYPNRLDYSHHTLKCFFQIKNSCFEFLHNIDIDQIKTVIENYDLYGESLMALKASKYINLRNFLHNKIEILSKKWQYHTHLGNVYRLYCKAHDHKHADYRKDINGVGNTIAIHYPEDIINCSDCNNLLQAYIDYVKNSRDDRNCEFADFIISNVTV